MIKLIHILIWKTFTWKSLKRIRQSS